MLPAHVASSLPSYAIEFSSGWHVNQSRGKVQRPFKHLMGWRRLALIEEPLIDRESCYQNPDSQSVDQIKPIKRVGLTYAWCHYFKEM